MDTKARASAHDVDIEDAFRSYSAQPQRDMLRVMANVWKWRKLSLFRYVAASVFVAAAALLLLPAKYTAVASLQIETQRTPSAAADRAVADTPIDNAILDSQVEIIRSDRIARTVIEKLRLWNDEEFNSNPGVIANSQAQSPVSADRKTDIARASVATAFKKNLSVFRYGRSYIAEVSFSGSDPVKAASIANAIANEYIDDLFTAKANAAQRTSEWLTSRIAAIREKTANTAEAIEDIKNSKSLIADKASKFAADQELQELSAELARVRDDQTRIRQTQTYAKSVLDTEGRNDRLLLPNIPQELLNPALAQLRQEHNELTKQRGQFAGPGGDQQRLDEVNLLLEAKTQGILDEVSRLVESSARDLAQAQAREQQLVQKTAETVQKRNTSRQNLIKLRELEAEEQSYKALYESALSRQIQATDQQTYPVTDARIVSPAAPPANKSSPSPPLMLLLAGFVGALAGFGRLSLVEAQRTVIREPEEISAETGLNELGFLPVIMGRLIFPTARAVPPLLIRDRFDALRRTKLAIGSITAGTSCCIAGVTSAADGAGRSTVAYNLAAVLAEDGHKTLLIDADIRNPSLSKGLRLKDSPLGAVLRGETDLASAVVQTDDRFDFIGGVDRRQLGHPSVVLSGVAFRDLLKDAGDVYDHIIIDLPNALTHIDVSAAIHTFDALVFVAEWGRTSTADIARIRNASPVFSQIIAGIIVNKAPRFFARRYNA